MGATFDTKLMRSVGNMLAAETKEKGCQLLLAPYRPWVRSLRRRPDPQRPNGFGNGLVISDWGGTYSTAEAVNAGLDLEMPDPTRWRGDSLHLSTFCRKVKKSTLNERVRNLLYLANKVRPALEHQTQGNKTWFRDTSEKWELCREVARSSIVLLKNDKNILPLDPSAQ
ncbi:hypothetical protein FALCPG4_018564 [Fusarium falciforme]